MQLNRLRLRSGFLRKARSEERAYPIVDLTAMREAHVPSGSLTRRAWEAKATHDEALRKKIKQTQPIQLHGYGLRPEIEFDAC